MKKELTFVVAWEVLMYLLVFVSHRLLSYLYHQKDSTFETKYFFFIFGAVIVVYIMFGIFLGVLMSNIKHFSIMGYILISLYALYFAIRLPIFYTGSKIVTYLYPKWMIFQRYDFATSLGSLLIGLLLITSFKNKINWLKK